MAQLAHDLGMLKFAAGDPSYDRMCRELGARASKSALSAAARGRDLPSWETTWEFVRCLAVPDQDLDVLRTEWRVRWETARGTEPDAAPATGTAPPRGSRGAWVVLVAAAVVMSALVAAGLVIWTEDDEGGTSRDLATESRPIPGDDARLLREVTIPDGTVVAPGSVFVKTWEFRNQGTVAWEDRVITRQNDSTGACRSVSQAPVPDARPGDSVHISVSVIAPDAPGACRVYWKMTDGDGRAYFPPPRRSFYYDVVVGPVTAPN